MWLFLDREILVGGRSHQRALHVAPEPSLSRRLSDRFATYVSFDLESPAANVHGDLTRAPFSDESFELIVCSHVLEHIVDDVGAARELVRVLSPSGVAVIQVPVDPNRDRTFEDPDIIEADDRRRAFGQADHVRIYGRDVTGRLEAAGFDVHEVDYRTTLASDADRYGATASETIYVCRTDR